MPDNNTLEWTGERYLPEIGGIIAIEHLHRYLVAREIVDGKDVLDIACGEGYGSALLADVAHHVSGVDISEEAVQHASNKYLKENLSFFVGSCAEIPLPNASVDVVVSFETIEHHNQHEVMMREIKRVLRPNGVLIISSPDKHEFSEVSKKSTHYHIKELYQEEFEKLISTYFTNVVFARQRVVLGSEIISENANGYTSNIAQNAYCKMAGTVNPPPLYHIAISSDINIPEIPSGILEMSSLELEKLLCCPLALAEKDKMLHQRNLEVAEKDLIIHKLNLDVLEQDKKLHARNLEVIEKDKKLHARNLEVIEKDKMLHIRNTELIGKDNIINKLNHELTDKNTELNQIKDSFLWKILNITRFSSRKSVNK